MSNLCWYLSSEALQKWAWSTQLSCFLEPNAAEYYFSSGVGREPFYHYLPISNIIFCAQAVHRRLTLDEVQILVAEDGGQNSEICTVSALASKKLNAQKVNQNPVMDNQVRFTPVRAVMLPPGLDMDHPRNLLKAHLARTGDLLVTLLNSNLWKYIGSYVQRPDGLRVPVSGAIWKFDTQTCRYTMSTSPIALMCRRAGSLNFLVANVGIDFIRELYRRRS